MLKKREDRANALSSLTSIFRNGTLPMRDQIGSYPSDTNLNRYWS